MLLVRLLQPINSKLVEMQYLIVSQEFGDVGLMTGDVTMAPEASILVLPSIHFCKSQYTPTKVNTLLQESIHSYKSQVNALLQESICHISQYVTSSYFQVMTTEILRNMMLRGSEVALSTFFHSLHSFIFRQCVRFLG